VTTASVAVGSSGAGAAEGVPQRGGQRERPRRDGLERQPRRLAQHPGRRDQFLADEHGRGAALARDDLAGRGRVVHQHVVGRLGQVAQRLEPHHGGLVRRGARRVGHVLEDDAVAADAQQHRRRPDAGLPEQVLQLRAEGHGGRGRQRGGLVRQRHGLLDGDRAAALRRRRHHEQPAGVRVDG
jgi:hypothetical protein